MRRAILTLTTCAATCAALMVGPATAGTGRHTVVGTSGTGT